MKTAVETLFDRIEEIGFIDPAAGQFYEEVISLKEQAKEMEKEQIIKSVVNTVKIGTKKEGVLFFTIEDEILIRNEAEQYYNETFKSE